MRRTDIKLIGQNFFLPTADKRMMIHSFYQLGIITRFIVLIYLVCSVKFRLLYHIFYPIFF